jgi:hypothetical protein
VRDRPRRRPRSSPRLEARDFDAVLMDLNYTRDTTSGTEGLDLLARSASSTPTCPSS